MNTLYGVEKSWSKLVAYCTKTRMASQVGTSGAGQQAQSESARYRLAGNEVYARAKADGINSQLRRQRYEECLVSYQRSLNCARDDSERSSSHKNLAMANWRLVEVLRDINPAYSSEDSAASEVDDDINVGELYRWQQALVGFCGAWEAGRNSGRDGEWMGSLIDSWWICFQSLLMACLDLTYRRRLEFLQRLQSSIGEGNFVLWQVLQKYLCDLKFNESVRCREAGNFQHAISSAQSCLQDTYQLMDSCERHGNAVALFDNYIQVIDPQTGKAHQAALNRIEQQERICRAMQACAVGDLVLDQAVNVTEELGVELVWEAVDHFHQSLLLARDHEIEQEAIAFSRLAKVFNRVLKMSEKALTYARRTAELAEALMPRNLHEEEWYRVAMEIIKRAQEDKRRAEEAQYQADVEKFKEELKDELAALEALTKEGEDGKKPSMQQILTHIYTRHPPKSKPDYKLPEKMTADDLKKLYRKALVHYHPDKVDKKVEGMKWFVLCSEITKLLTGRYEVLKGSLPSVPHTCC